MLPTTIGKPARARAATKKVGFGGVVQKIFKPAHMDMEYALWMMVQLLTHPKMAYRHVSYHKQTRDQWARDDPAFTVLCCFFQAVSALAWCIAFRSSLVGTLWTVARAVLVDFLAMALLVTLMGYYSCKYFLTRPSQAGGFSPAVEQGVEFWYCFDVHLNAWVPCLILTGVVEFALCPFLLRPGLFPRLASLALWSTSMLYYGYLSFLGYSTLPSVSPARAKGMLWWPMLSTGVLVPTFLLLGTNPTALYARAFMG